MKAFQDSDLPGLSLSTPMSLQQKTSHQLSNFGNLYILHIDSDEGKINITLPALQIPIPESIAEPAPSISATVLEPTPSTSTAILETSPSCSFAKVSDVAPIPKITVEESTNRKTVNKQQSEVCDDDEIHTCSGTSKTR
ncbi:hypothetical protein JTB14_036512 [Gonioctena quinquepunctata]|nr:hypothetical protein JTB14_036512 [Gonioctena quinquepunctata]